MVRRKIAFLTASLLLFGAMTGCGSGSNHTGIISSKEEQNSPSTDANSSEGDYNESDTTIRKAFFEKLKTAPEFTIIFREKTGEDTDSFDDGTDIYYSDNGKKFQIASYDAGKVSSTITYDGTDYYYYLPDAAVYGKGIRIFEEFKETDPDSFNFRDELMTVFDSVLEKEFMGAEGIPVDSGRMDYEGKTCRYESYAVRDWNNNERNRWLFDERGDFCGLVTEREGNIGQPMENYAVSFSIPDDSALFSVPQDYSECTYAFHRLYRYYEEPLSWTEAEAACSKLGGHLASVPTQEIQDFLFSMTENESAENIWLGGYYDSQDGIWKWTNGWDDGYAFDNYSNWDMHVNNSGKEFWQPDNYSGKEFYLRYANKNIQYAEWYCNAGRWNDTENGGDSDAPLSSFGYICEWSPYDD